MQRSVRTPVLLYRHLLRCIKQLPEETHAHYKHHVRQSYASHGDETDPKRIQQIIDRALQDAEWLLKKSYASHGDETDPKRIQQIIDRALQDAEWLLKKYKK